MSRRAVFVLIATALVAMLATNLTTYNRAEAQEVGRFILTVRNVTAGQPLTQPVVVVHDGGAELLPESAEDLAGLEELAESGQGAALAASLRGVVGVKDTVSIDPPPLPPGDPLEMVIAASPGDHISVISMLACTNDAITIGTLIVPEAESLPAMSSGRVWRSVPRGALPTAVRRLVTMTASLTTNPLFRASFRFDGCSLIDEPAGKSVSQRLARPQHVLNARLSFRLAVEAQRCLPFQVQQVLLADGSRARQPASAQHVSNLACNDGVMVADVASAAEHVNANL